MAIYIEFLRLALMLLVQLRLLGFRAFDSLHRKVLGEDPQRFSPFALVFHATPTQSSQAIRTALGEIESALQGPLCTCVVSMRMSAVPIRMQGIYGTKHWMAAQLGTARGRGRSAAARVQGPQTAQAGIGSANARRVTVRGPTLGRAESQPRVPAPILWRAGSRPSSLGRLQPV